MAKQRYINTKFWQDAYIRKLKPIEKLLYIYILTNPLTNIAGIYEIPLEQIAFDTGIAINETTKILTKFEQDNKIKYQDENIAICNFIKHQNYTNPKIKKAIMEEFKNCNLDLLGWVLSKNKGLKENLIAYGYPIHTLSIPYLYPMDSLSHVTESNIIESNITKTDSCSTSNEVEPACDNFSEIPDLIPENKKPKTQASKPKKEPTIFVQCRDIYVDMFLKCYKTKFEYDKSPQLYTKDIKWLMGKVGEDIEKFKKIIKSAFYDEYWWNKDGSTVMPQKIKKYYEDIASRLNGGAGKQPFKSSNPMGYTYFEEGD